MIISAKSVAPMDLIWQYRDDYIAFLKTELSKRMAEGVWDILSREPSIAILKQDLKSFPDFNRAEANYQASIEWQPLVKCKECIHRPKPWYPGANVFKNDFPDDVCPYRNKEGCLDIWESKCPPDDFFCASGEREGKTDAKIH